MSEGVCVKYIKKGQSVTLCITDNTTTPSTIPQGKNIIIISNSLWLVNYGDVSKTLYSCSRDSCTPWSNFTDVNYTRYSVATDNCLTVTEAQENETYIFKAFYNPISPSESNVSFYMSYEPGELLVYDHYHGAHELTDTCMPTYSVTQKSLLLINLLFFRCSITYYFCKTQRIISYLSPPLSLSLLESS